MFGDFNQKLSLARTLLGVLTHHTCCLHLHHRRAEQPQQKKTQQEVSSRPSYLPHRYLGQDRCSSSFPFSVLFLTFPTTPTRYFSCCYLSSLPPLSLPAFLPFAFCSLLSSPTSPGEDVSLSPLSHGSDSVNQLSMCSALIG